MERNIQKNAYTAIQTVVCCHPFFQRIISSALSIPQKYGPIFETNLLKLTVVIGIDRESLVVNNFGAPFPAGALGLLGAFAGIGRAEESSICWKLKPDDAFFVPVGEWGWAVDVVRCPTAFSGCGRLVTILGAGRMSSEGSEDSSLVAEEGISTYCRVAITRRSRCSKEVALE